MNTAGPIEARSTAKGKLARLLAASLLLGAACFVLGLGATRAGSGTGKAAEKYPADEGPVNDWLRSAPNDTERYHLVEEQFGGMDQSMWQVGIRLRVIHEALQRGNFDLAIYEWSRIGLLIRRGLVRRPRIAQDAERFLFGETFDSIRAEFEKRDYAAAVVAFNRAKAACIGCHAAREIPFVNNQSLFELTLPPTPAKTKH